MQAEQRPATSAEQAVLARWGGWGAQGVWQVFDEARVEHAEDRAVLRRVLSEAEYAAARLTTVNAHYTDAALVGAVWEAVSGLGFTGGRVLEPGCGAGTFVGLAPAAAELTGVELDPTTAAIAALLYPEATIRAESFADTRFPRGHFDAVVGNVPFADVVLHDPAFNAQRLALHNYFIVKSLHLTRPGGLVAVLTSRYTMDAANPAARRAMGDLADLVGAVRLPSKAHWRAAGTEAVTDLLILRRREPGRGLADPTWLATSPVVMQGPSGADEPARINHYWQANPHRVLGSHALEVGMHGVAGVVVHATGGLEQLPGQLRAQLADITTVAQQTGLTWAPATGEQAAAAAGWVPAWAGAVDGEIVAHSDGRFTVVESGGQVPLTVPRTQAGEVRALLGLRDQARELIATEAASLDDTPELEEARRSLRTGWEAYVARYGPINRFTLRSSGRVDPSTGEALQSRITPPAVRLVTSSTFGSIVSALEVFDDLSQTAEPCGLMRHRQVVPRQPVQGVDNAADGLAVVLDRLGRVDVEAIADLMGVEAGKVIADLDGQIVQEPGTDRWHTRAAYTSGNVREKLVAAVAAEAADPGRWAANVAMLEAVLPEDVLPGDITARPGAVWIPDTDHEVFLRELLHARHGVSVHRLNGADWEIQAPSWGVEATKEWGTDRMPAGRIFGALIAQRKIAIYDTQPDKSQIFNPTATAEAQEKARLMAERFNDWVWEDPDRATRLLADYNRIFNSVVLRDYTHEGDHLSLPGLARSFTPRQHQRAAVARMINEPSVGLFHDVGAGKTAEMVIGATELRRLGLIRKPAVVVPNNMLEQFAREWLQLYPQAKVLAAGSEDLAADARRRFVARVATNDWDAVILTRTAFERLSLTPASEAAYLERELAGVRRRLETVRNERGETRGVKRVEKAMLRAQERLEAMRDVPVDPDLHFEQTGIDYLIIDELHQYKNLATSSAISDANIEGSKRASDLHAKIDYLRHSKGERVVTGATATPIANSITEMYVMQRYLDPETLTRAGIHDFDSWAATFGEVVTVTELAVAGANTFKVKNRFAKFTNVPELLAMFHTFGDVKTAADLDLPRPQLVARPDGQRAPKLIVVDPNPDQLAYMDDIGERADAIQRRLVTPEEDNMLKLSSDARKAALDMRLVHPGAQPGPGKIDAAADELARVWEATRHQEYLDPDTGEISAVRGALQIVFCDLGTPSDKWNVYAALKDALVVRGLPPGSVRFIHEARNDTEKAKLFAACRAGHVAVIVGSTEKMGVGTNIQNRAVHLLDLDAPWRPADVEQRHGRLLRQGNQNPEVTISQVITANSFDSFMWQTLERKSRFIDQVMTGKGVGRDTEDIGAATLSYAETKAVSSGNPLLLELAAAEADLDRLSRLERAHTISERTLEQTISHATRSLAVARQTVTNLEALDQRTRPTAGDAFAIRIQPLNTTSPAEWTSERGPAADRLGRLLTYTIGSSYQSNPVHVADLGGHRIDAKGTRSWGPGGEVVHTTWSVHGSNDQVAITTSWEPADRKTRRVDLGTIARLEHLVASIPAHITRTTTRIAELENTITQADRVRGKPFRHADALTAARQRYTAITAAIAERNDQPTTDPAAVTTTWETVTTGPSPGLAHQRATPTAPTPAPPGIGL